ncbi:flagellar hook-basal body complex protein [Acidovorax sp. GBBC 3334]|uniref:flagellar hook-basal body complex protein n=1 Tax=unclassified Acidovorax TaxID=2684926 RepID=UPI00230310BC|nr:MULTISPECIES: flagellar hook-basal body complex protein [unclassified Acidovorax]MDA8456964.1 flagellar hook-basal body complex protein [Acidovorax sp. GBBC 3334]MDA8521020.1 flagellar hook-basal body complex protein [Acidovorax sp. NCPPB 4044]
MIESIYVGMTGLSSFSRGLRVIANNTTNLNTPGFKSASLRFSDAFYSNGGYTGRQFGQMGYGVSTMGTSMSFKSGELRQTGNGLDLAIDGQGLFTLKGSDGSIRYTRAGQFQFNSDGVLVSQGKGATVMGVGADGSPSEISIANLKTSAGKATAVVKFTGNLSSTGTDQTINGVRVFDAAGGEHLLTAKLTSTNSTTPGSWKVELMDGTTVVGTQELIFQDGKPTAATGKLAFSYTPAGQAALPLTLDFGTDVTSFASGTLSTLAFASQDGFAPAELSSASFDATGTLVLTYANGQTAKGARLSLGRFDTTEAVGSAGDNEFEALDGRAWHSGVAGGAFGSVRSGYIEISNVDLSQEFSDLVIMQRGYQASSQVISTANEMLQELFSMKSR